MHRFHQHGIRSTTRPHKKKPKKERPIIGTDLVTVVLEQVFPQGIPVDKFDVVMRWRDATIEFMKEVS
jgi:hypothetical protein